VLNLGGLTVVSTRFLLVLLLVTGSCWLLLLRHLVRRRRAVAAGRERRRRWRAPALAAVAVVLRQLSAISATLRQDGMTVQLHSRPGSHTYSVWRPALQESLTWALSGDGPAAGPAATTTTTTTNSVGPVADRIAGWRISSDAP
jgi:hypothetical protein